MGHVYPQIVTSADMLKSIIRIEELIPFLQEQNAKSAAIVNSKLYGVLPFWQQLKNAGIHPVIGISISVSFTDDLSLPVYLYAETEKGYKNLLKISSSLSVKELDSLPLNWLKAYSSGCIVSLPMTDAGWNNSDWHQTLQQLLSIFQKDKILIGISRPNGEVLENEHAIVETAHQFGITIGAVQTSCYMQKNDSFAYSVLRAIDSGETLSQIGPSGLDKGNNFLPTKVQWEEWFADKQEWLLNSENMLLRCKGEPILGDRFMPKYPLPDHITSDAELLRQCEEGLAKRIGSIQQNYFERMHYELEVISEMGYADYFLIVADFMEFARNKNILTGPGRGSSAGSLIAYALSITDVDPLKYNLVFERFLNPERITMPDIDIDFADDRRHEVIQYVAEKYGKNFTAQIITFGTLSAKSAARDVGRVFGFESTDLDRVSKMIPNKVGITLQDAYTHSTELREWIASDVMKQKWFSTALKLEGIPRHGSTHAAGVVLTPVPLVDIVPIEIGNDEMYLTQWPMNEVEASGLLKMDFLGLRNLTMLENIRSMIRFNERKWVDFEQIPLDDANTFRLLQMGDTTGVFQLESDGMRSTLREIRPTEFGDIVAINALYRPGPMENIPVYKRRKHKEESIHYIHPILEPILKETYGVIVYQEQIMQIAVQMAGFKMGEADLLRRAVSKKKKDLLNKERQHFVSSSIANGFDEKAANEVYDFIVRFADYGFPKSHAVAYSMISYYLAYLKVHYPAYFYASLLSNAIGNHEKLVKLLQEVRDKNIPILPPSITKSFHNFSVENGAIRFGLSAVKGISAQFNKALYRIRKNGDGHWKDMFEMAVSLSAAHFTRKSIEPLIKAGALDEFHENRAVLLGSLDAAIMHADLVRPTDDPDLFEGDLSSFGKPKYAEKEQIPLMMKLQFEREVLGFYLSDHPAVEVKKNANVDVTSVLEVSKKRNGSFVHVIGLVVEIKRIRTKKGESMAFVTLQDETGTISCTLFPKEFATFNVSLKEWSIIHISGSVEWRQGKPQIIVKQIKS